MRHGDRIEEIHAGFTSLYDLCYFGVALDRKALATHQVEVRDGLVSKPASQEFQGRQNLAKPAPMHAVSLLDHVNIAVNDACEIREIGFPIEMQIACPDCS